MRTVPKPASPTACRFCHTLAVVWDVQPGEGWARICVACGREQTPQPQPLPFLRNGAAVR